MMKSPSAVLLCCAFVLFGTRVEGQTCAADKVTPSDHKGPFYVANSPVRDLIAPLELLSIPSNVLHVQGQVLGNDCVPIANAVVEPWYAGPGGEYSTSDDPDMKYRGQILADDCGFFNFTQTYPDIYPSRPIRHIHFRVSSGQGNELLVTQLYFEGDVPAQYNPDEAQIGSVETLVDGSRLVIFDMIVNSPGTTSSLCTDDSPEAGDSPSAADDVTTPAPSVTPATTTLEADSEGGPIAKSTTESSWSPAELLSSYRFVRLSLLLLTAM